MGDTAAFDRRAARIAAGLAVAFGVFAAFLSGAVADRGGWWPDDAIYRFQGRCLAIGRTWVNDPPERAAFTVAGTTHYEGRWFGKYYPGFPVILGAGEIAGVPWIVNPLLGAAAIFATFLLGRALVSASAGLAAATCLAFSPVHINLSVGYLSHATSMATALGAATAFALARARGSRGLAVLGGVLAGWCAATRPYTFALLAIPCIVIAVRDLATRRTASVRWMIPFAAALFPGLVTMFIWNATLTGSPMTSAYEVATPKDGLGFVELAYHRGTKERVRFTPAMAVEATRAQLRSAAETVFPLPLPGPFAFLLALPLLGPIVFPEIRSQGAVLAALAVVLIGGHFFYPGIRGVSATGLGPRYYVEGLPFYFVLLAITVSAAAARWRAPRWVGPALCIALAIAGLGWSAPRAFERVRDRHANLAASQNELLRNWLDHLEPGRRLVFVDVSTYDEMSTTLANRPDLTGDNVVAVYRYPEQNRAVIDQFPGREAFLLRWDRQISSPDLRRYDPDDDAVGPPKMFPYTKRRYARNPSEPSAEDETSESEP